LKIDEKKLSESVEKIKNNVQKEFFLSEIVFVKKKELSLESLINNINTSINDIGFSNTANIFSISETAKLGGKIGWVNENSLTKSILEKLENLKEGEKTEVIKIKNNYIIIKIDKIRTNEIQIDKEKELEKLIQIETNKQLNQFSRIFFDKSKINYSINEK
ncbi:peptidylprolyl isomerase, partial [Candidatus Pelagibacter sp.]|nr:peptidylprolyl isomerase [Candidatus Pelagibacter sp.]